MRYMIAGLTVLITLFGRDARAIPITFDFTGTVTQVPVLDPVDPFGGTIAFGTSFNGNYTFESSTPDSDPSASTASYQMTSGSPFGLNLTIGGNLFTASDFLAINVQNAFSDFYGALACQGGCGGDLTISLSFFDSSGTAFGSTALPLSPPSLSSFDTMTLALSGFVSGNQVQIDGNVTTLSLSSTPPGTDPPPGTLPLPGTLLLLATGLAGLGWCSWRQLTLRHRAGVVLEGGGWLPQDRVPL